MGPKNKNNNNIFQTQIYSHLLSNKYISTYYCSPMSLSNYEIFPKTSDFRDEHPKVPIRKKNRMRYIS